MSRQESMDQLALFKPPDPVHRLGEVWGYFWSTPRGQDVKHGKSGKVYKRGKQLQTGNPDDLILMGAYPDYSEDLERAVHEYFGHLRKPGTEWFATNSLEIKIVALGDGLPFELLAGLSALNEARRDLVLETEGPSIDIKLSNLQIWTDRRWLRDQQTKLISEAMMALTGSRDEWRARQPIEVQVEQLWQARLNGQRPFDMRSASLQPSRLLELLDSFRKIGATA